MFFRSYREDFRDVMRISSVIEVFLMLSRFVTVIVTFARLASTTGGGGPRFFVTYYLVKIYYKF